MTRVIDAFGVDLANPLEAHAAYKKDARIIALMANGVGNENTSPIIKERCQPLVISD